MKFVAITLFAFVAAAIAAPTNISGNNVGDVVTVGINANAVFSNSINQNILSVIAALLNQQAIGVAPGQSGSDGNDHFENEIPQIKDIEVSPEVVDKIKEHITPEMIEKFKHLVKQI